MSGSDRPTRQVSLASESDLTHAFARMGCEHLDVTESRTVIIFSGDILLVDVTTGRLDAAEAFTVEFWEPAPDEDRDPERVVDTFVDTVTSLVNENS